MNLKTTCLERPHIALAEVRYWCFSTIEPAAKDHLS